MSEHDAKLYQQFMSKVKKQVDAIQLILNNVQVLGCTHNYVVCHKLSVIQSKGLERQWIKHQTSGDLDDSKV